MGDKSIPIEFIQQYIDKLYELSKEAEKESPRFAETLSLKAFHFEKLIEAWEDTQKAD